MKKPREYSYRYGEDVSNVVHLIDFARRPYGQEEGARLPPSLRLRGESERPDRESCLILDIRLRGTRGLDFQRKLPESGITIPIIFITGHGDIQMFVRAMKGGGHRISDETVSRSGPSGRNSARAVGEERKAGLQTSFETLTPQGTAGISPGDLGVAEQTNRRPTGNQ